MVFGSAPVHHTHRALPLQRTEIVINHRHIICPLSADGRIHLIFIFDLLRGVLLIVIVRLPLTSEVHVFSWPQGGQPRDLQPCVALGISKQCMDLLTKLLQQNPKARCRMKDVLNHPWFLSDLPPGATSTNKVCLEAT